MSIKVSADAFTKKYLGINEELSDSEARQVCEKLADNKHYRGGLSEDKLVIQRFLRD
jgi:hypothetical protein